MPISTRRVMAPGASFVCSVENTRWPVSEARIAISAVSLSRISPTMMTSGSWRSTCRERIGKREEGADLRANLHLVSARRTSYSIGSSIVMIRRSVELIFAKKRV